MKIVIKYEMWGCGSLALADARGHSRSVEYRHAALRRAPTTCSVFLVRTLALPVDLLNSRQSHAISKEHDKP